MKTDQMLFGDFYFNVCRNPEDYLTAYYGDNWREIGFTQDYCHKQRRDMQPVEIELNSKMYSPAKPFR